MFQSSAHRLRAWLTRFDDVLADHPDDAHEPQDDPLSHPHRRPLRWERARRSGAVAARAAHCICPVRATTEADERVRAAY
jgi:hypothetical protein